MSVISLPAPLVGTIGKIPKWLLAAIAALVIVGFIAGTIVLVRGNAAPQVVTTPVVRQTLTQSVTASGTVNAQNTITVGTQVSGTIAELDVDFNSKVREGQVLARIDPSTFQAQVNQASAAVAQAQAQANAASANASGASSSIAVSNAAVAKARDALVLAQQTYNRDNALLKQGYIAQSAVDADSANLTQAQAALAGAQATVAQSASSAQGQAATAVAASAAIGTAQAQLQQYQLSLQRSVITSPVNGTIVSRAVSIGQTVAASLQAPTLFTIAQDLRKMEVDINVGEPDIGNVKPGDSVNFTVLAYPTQVFHGTVKEVRINPQTVNNVVTYQVIVDVANQKGQLLPGMTANATINVASVRNALVVPLSALRQRGSSSQSPWGQTSAGGGASAAILAGQNAMLTVQRDGKLQRVQVNVQLVTSTQAAVMPINGATLSEGDAVITSLRQASGDRTGAGRSPLTPGGPTRGATRGIP